MLFLLYTFLRELPAFRVNYSICTLYELALVALYHTSSNCGSCEPSLFTIGVLALNAQLVNMLHAVCVCDLKGPCIRQSPFSCL